MSEKNPIHIYFKLPKQKTIYYVHSKLNNKKVMLNKVINKTAFVISPFNNGNKVFYAPITKIKALKHIKPNHDFFFKNFVEPKEENYTEQVNKAISLLNENETSLKKVVIARTKMVSHNKIDFFDTFSAVCNEYQKHFCYLITSATTGTIIGATPEVLIDFKNGKAKTVALAGTKNNESLNWTHKEIHEQYLVQKHIEKKLKKAKILFKKTKLKTIQSGNLQHLCTNYHFNIKRNQVPALVKNLNPTPAVAGLPINSSLAFIEKTEIFSRNFYSGFIGVLNFNKTIKLFVNLRCAEVLKNTLQLFAGAGITKQSNAEKEFIETENKMNAIARFFV